MWIYKVTNLINGKIYIGQTHYDNEKYLGSGNKIKRAVLKYGFENFKREYIDTADTQDELDKKEIFWIKELNSQDPTIGYNIADGGWNCLTMNDEIKEKLSLTWRKKYEGGYINNRIGTTMSDEVKKRISEGNKGKKISEENKRKLSEFHRGKKLSESTRKKLSESHKGKKLSEFHKRSISKSLKGRPVSDETKQKLRNSNINKTQKNSKIVIAINNETMESLRFNNISQAARYFNIFRSYIRNNKIKGWNIKLIYDT